MWQLLLQCLKGHDDKKLFAFKLILLLSGCASSGMLTHGDADKALSTWAEVVDDSLE